jgi:ribosomal-protein-alanine N-acetyltransferase
MRITIRSPRSTDEAVFLAAVRRSRALHHPWVKPPSSSAAFRKSLARWRRPAHRSFFVWRHRAELIGVINLSEIVRGSFRSAYLGYYAFEPWAGQGLMRIGMARVISYAFGKQKLHRLEANIQPANEASVRFVKRLGFRREGYSPRYLKVAGRWRDHERWAILTEDW